MLQYASLDTVTTSWLFVNCEKFEAVVSEKLEQTTVAKVECIDETMINILGAVLPNSGETKK